MDGMTNTECSWNFPVEFHPLKYWDEHNTDQDIYVPESLGRVLVRTDTNQPLAIHKGRYTIKTNEDCVNQMDDAIRAANIGTDYDWNITTIDQGRRMKATVDFRDLVVEPAKDDYIHFRISLFNSYDGTWSFIFSAAGLRLWCLNGCTTPDNVASSRNKHTASINVEQEAGKIGKALDAFMNQREVWQKYMGISLRDHRETVEQWLKTRLCMYPTATSNLKYNERQLETLMRQYDKECSSLGSNMWALYNTLTHWASHPEDNRAHDAITTRNRDMQIAKAMSSNEWKVFEKF